MVMADESRSNAKLEELFAAAHKNPQLRMELLEDPQRVAEKWGVELPERTVTRLRKVGAFLELADEAKSRRLFRCDPRVCYPATLWQRQSLLELVKELVIDVRLKKGDEVFYPAPELLPAVEVKLDRNLGLAR
jgi:hypothetical protein